MYRFLFRLLTFLNYFELQKLLAYQIIYFGLSSQNIHLKVWIFRQVSIAKAVIREMVLFWPISLTNRSRNSLEFRIWTLQSG